MVEGTPLLRAHLGQPWLPGSTPCVSARASTETRIATGFAGFSFILTCACTCVLSDLLLLARSVIGTFLKAGIVPAVFSDPIAQISQVQ